MLYEVRYLGKDDRWNYATVRAVSVKQAVFLVGLRHRNGYINRLLGRGINLSTSECCDGRTMMVVARAAFLFFYLMNMLI